MFARVMLAFAVLVAALTHHPVAARAATLSTLYVFTGGLDGGTPLAGLIDEGGILYGTAYSGGVSDYGAVFSIEPVTGSETVLYSFAGGTDGSGPSAALTYASGVLYGTTSYGGGASNGGTVFKVDPATGVEAVLYRFDNGVHGGNPLGALIYEGGRLYGTTSHGGHSQGGTVFEFNPASGVETVLYSFKPDGGYPAAGLIYEGGYLYGTTTASLVTVFKIDLKTHAMTTLHSFTGGGDGIIPLGGLVYQSGTLYGTTLKGGTSGYGTVFKVDPITGAEAVLYSFKGGAHGEYPQAAPTYHDGYLYGTTYGLSDFFGTVFKVNPKSGTEAVLYSFTGGDDGANPASKLLFEGDSFYGTTSGSYDSAASNSGTVFKLTP
jgi:uncharacterized repeat protein (TIGR03803 family)